MWFSRQIRCFIAILFLLLVIELPLILLWGIWGLIVGSFFGLMLVFFLRLDGERTFLKRFGVNRLSVAEAPELYVALSEYCRRLNIPLPVFGVIPRDDINVVFFGFKKSRTFLLMTEGALRLLTREEKLSLIGRALTVFWSGDILCLTWFSQIMSLFDRFVFGSSSLRKNREYPFRFFLSQILLSPLLKTLEFILVPNPRSERWDLKTVRLTRNPRALSESLRKIDLILEKTKVGVDVFSSRPLFLVPPRIEDPIVSFFVRVRNLKFRVKTLESISHLVELS